MLRDARRNWHLKVAKVIEQVSPDTVDLEPETLGHHYQQAGDYIAAEQFWRAAARLAMRRSANVEAIQHLRHALTCLNHDEETEARDRREMDLQITIAVPYAFVNGYAHETVRTTYARAQELCSKYGEIEQLFKVVYGQFRSSMLGAEYAISVENLAILQPICEETDDPLISTAVQRCHGSVLTYLGRPSEAIPFLEKGIAAELSFGYRKRGLDFDVVDLSVALHSYLAWSCWLSGDSARAKDAISKALDLAKVTQHSFTIAFSLAFASWIYHFVGDEESTRNSSSRLITLFEEHTFQFWLGWGRVINGWSKQKELGEKSLEVIQQGLDQWRGTGSRLGLSYFLYLQADAMRSMDQTDRAQQVIAEAEAFQEQSGEGFWKPELVHLNGRIALQKGDEKTARTEFMRTISIELQ